LCFIKDEDAVGVCSRGLTKKVDSDFSLVIAELSFLVYAFLYFSNCNTCRIG
jgi:hypothetical protein